MNIQKLFTFALIAGTIMTSQLPAVAAPYIPGHPRVNEVNNRLSDQHARIEQGLTSGTLSPGQALRLREEYAGLKTEEHIMRADDHGHLTIADQHALNQQLNQRSGQIYHFKH